MTSTTTATGDGFGSPLDMLWSADQVARLLALAEQANRCDGWLTADDLGRLSLDAPREDHGEKWRTAIARLGEQFTNLHIFLANSPGYPRLLLETAHAPAVLFVRGSLDSNGAGSVAMVGSRDASEQAADAAREVAAALADAGTTIVSDSPAASIPLHTGELLTPVDAQLPWSAQVSMWSSRRRTGISSSRSSVVARSCRSSRQVSARPRPASRCATL